MTEQKVKAKKKPGPIRTGAVVPFIIITTGIVVFNIMFLDTALRRGFEYAATQGNGAEVNIESVETKFVELSIAIRKIEFTNKEIPSRNSFEIGEIKFKMLADALLRAKVVIDLAQIKDIRINTKRTKPGYVIPPEPPKDEDSKLAQEALSKAQSQFKGNVLGDAAGLMASGGDTNSLKIDANDLATKKHLNELEAQYKIREAKLKTTVDALPKDAELKALEARIKGINWNDLKDLRKAPQLLKDVDKIKKDIEKTVAMYDSAVKAVEADIKYFKEGTNSINGLINDDLSNLQARLKLPKLDVETIARMIVGPEVLAKVEKMQHYFGMAKKYMPPKKEGEDDSKPIPPPRGKGRNYQFGRPNAYPLFWLKLASINSITEQGTVAGQVLHLSSDQRTAGHPTSVQVQANFPQENILGIDGKLMFDHRNGSHDRLDLKVGSYKVGEKILVKSKDAKFGLTESLGHTTLVGDLRDGILDFKLDNAFDNIVFDVGADNAILNEILNDVASSMNVLILNASINGPWNNLRFDLRSNLAEMLQSSIQKVVQAKIDEAKRKIEEQVNALIAEQKAMIEGQVKALESQYKAQINKEKAKVDGMVKKLNDEKKKQEKAAKNVEKQGKKAIDDLLKKNKIKF